MDNFNKIISFVLGLVVVIVFLAVITGRFNIRKSFQGLGQQTKVTPTPTLIAGQNLSPTPVSVASGQANTTNYRTNAKTPTSIPATGSPSILLPIIFSSLSLGIYLKRKS